MNIHRIILATDTNPYYLDFLPIITYAWKKLFGPNISIDIGYISPTEPESYLYEYGNIHRFWIPDIPIPNLAMTSRLLIAQMFPTDSCLISDIDMLPLKAEYFKNGAKDIDDDKLIIYSSDAYHQPYLYPMCYLLAKGSTYKEIINPSGLDIPSLIESWKWYWRDPKEDISRTPFADESLLCRLLQFWNKVEKMVLLKRGWRHGIADDRIDRFCWKIPDNLGHIIDAHLERPLNTKNIYPLIEYIKGAS